MQDHSKVSWNTEVRMDLHLEQLLVFCDCWVLIAPLINSELVGVDALIRWQLWKSQKAE